MVTAPTRKPVSPPNATPAMMTIWNSRGVYSVKDTVKDIAAIRSGKLLIELLANIGAFGPIIAIKTMQPPVPLRDFLPQVGNLPAGGMSHINSQLNLVPKE